MLGKLLKYCGEDNVLWGTDCIWAGSPQPQIAAFRTFKIDPQFAARNPTDREGMLRWFANHGNRWQLG